MLFVATQVHPLHKSTTNRESNTPLGHSLSTSCRRGRPQTSTPYTLQTFYPPKDSYAYRCSRHLPARAPTTEGP